MLLRGRYQEAEEEIEAALGIKSDYCEAHVLGVRLEALTSDPPAALERLDRLAAIPTCAYYQEFAYFCGMRAWLTYLGGDVEGAWEIAAGECCQPRSDLLQRSAQGALLPHPGQDHQQRGGDQRDQRPAWRRGGCIAGRSQERCLQLPEPLLKAREARVQVAHPRARLSLLTALQVA